MLLPAGTIYCGTGKQHAVGEVQNVLSGILLPAASTGNRTRHLAEATTRLTTAVATAWLAAGESPFLSGLVCGKDL